MVTGVLPQLLYSITESELRPLLLHREWWAQEKLDGRRLLIRKAGEEVVGINRRGLLVALPATLEDDAMSLPRDCIIDGEAVGNEHHVFDLLRLDGEDLRSKGYIVRFLLLMQLASYRAACPRFRYSLILGIPRMCSPRNQYTPK